MDGILLFDKPILWTSHDAVDFLRRKIRQKSVGHAGTLDPMATGLLVLLVGRATKRFQELMGLDKDYRGILTLGVATDTHDFEGRIVSAGEYGALSEKELQKAFAGFRGERFQTPPAFSAVSKGGKKLYRAARQGVFVEADARPILISRFDMTGFEPPDVHFFLTCSKGTYVRTLCDEMGRRLGCGAALSALSRTRVGNYRLDRALDAEAVSRKSAGEIEAALLR